MKLKFLTSLFICNSCLRAKYSLLRNHLTDSSLRMLSSVSSDREVAREWVEKFARRYFVWNGAKQFYLKQHSELKAIERTDSSGLELESCVLQTLMNGEKEKIRLLSVDAANDFRHPNFPPEYDVIARSITNRSLDCLENIESASMDVVYLEGALTSLPSSKERALLIQRSKRLLRNPGHAGFPHRAGLLLVNEKLRDLWSDDTQRSPLKNVLKNWSDAICNHGFVEARGFTLKAPSQEIHAVLAFVTSSRLSVDETNAQERWKQQRFAVSTSPKQRSFNIQKYLPNPVVIVGGGLAGTALAVDFHKKNIPFVVIEKDKSLNARKQGYALTIQQGNAACRQFGISPAMLHAISTTSKSHISLRADGEVLGHYSAQYLSAQKQKPSCERVAIAASQPERVKIVAVNPDSLNFDAIANIHKHRRHNVHLPRQALRELIYRQSDVGQHFIWGDSICSLEQVAWDKVRVELDSGKHIDASVVVGADGIYSSVRRLLGRITLASGLHMPLQYLGLLVILGISPTLLFSSIDNGLTHDFNRRSIQWVDGVSRVFTMPFDEKHTMWQMSFPIAEMEAIKLTNQGSILKDLALQTVIGWDSVLHDLILETDASFISGHPAYDRDPIIPSDFIGTNCGRDSLITLLGDAAHPMSPFKGQGANQALLDAAALGNQISAFLNDKHADDWSVGRCLRVFEEEMCERTASKVLGSRDAAKYLHSSAALVKGDITRAAAAASGENFGF